MEGGDSKQKEILFSPNRLALRLAMLESLALPSLTAQSDQNFQLMILCSKDMPPAALQSLNEVCASALGASKFTLYRRPYGWAHRYLTKFLVQRYGLNPVIQTVLDDDDAFAKNLVAQIRQELRAMPERDDWNTPRFISFVDGFGLDISDVAQENFALYAHRYPFVNLGLTMVGQADGKNLFSIQHRKTPAQGDARMVKGSPMFVRTLHGANDSRVAVTTRWKALKNWRASPKVLARFPYLAAF